MSYAAPTTPDELAGPFAAWARLALDLPRFHRPAEAGDVAELRARVADLPPLPEETVAALSDDEALLAALDALMIEAFLRRHAARLPGEVHAGILPPAERLAARLGLKPILSYPLYVRVNPMAPERTRLFTPLASEARFVRMHRAIEDRFDEVIRRLEEVLAAPDRRAAVRALAPWLGDTFRQVNGIMGGFRSQRRIPRDAFVDGFRPYYASVYDEASGELLLDGPSGLQSPTFRIIAMLTGYRDEILDGWTRRIGRYHDRELRQQLEAMIAARDAGMALGGCVDEILGRPDELPHLHPDYAAHIPDLQRLALAGGWLSKAALEALAGEGLPVGYWPAEAPAGEPLPAPRGDTLAGLAPEAMEELGTYARIESMLFGFHVEHVSVAAVQIGHVRGTGGTSGVEFLFMALFRRAFPGLWQAGLGARVAEHPPVAANGS